MRVGRITLFGLATAGAIALGIGAAEVHQRYGDRIITMASGSPYDDPAVAACEFTRLRGRAPSAAEYSRQSAQIDGTVVSISYTTSPLNTAPQKHEYSCAFKTGSDGAYVLDRDLMKRTSECTETARLLRAELDTGATRVRRDEMRAILDECRRVIDEEQSAAFRTLLDEDLALGLAGIYPIKPENTALR